MIKIEKEIKIKSNGKEYILLQRKRVTEGCKIERNLATVEGKKLLSWGNYFYCWSKDNIVLFKTSKGYALYEFIADNDIRLRKIVETDWVDLMDEDDTSLFIIKRRRRYGLWSRKHEVLPAKYLSIYWNNDKTKIFAESFFGIRVMTNWN